MIIKRFFPCIVLVFIATIGLAQPSDTTFNKQWKEIDSLINQQNLPQSALQKLNVIYQEATKKKLSSQQIKCLVYRINLEASTAENDPSKSIGILDSVLQKTTDIAIHSLLEGLIAFEYKTYFNQNRWRYYNRSNTINFKKEDINTWTSDDFNAAISQHYLLSLQAPAILQQMSLARFDAIITKGNTRELRPTLYDLLAHEALDYFKSGEAYVTKPTYAFVLDDSKALLPATDFTNAVFTSEDTASHQLITLHIFQQLVAFHQSKNNNPALVDVNLERIEWVNQNGVFGTKSVLYQAALEAITTQYPHQKETLQAWYLLAKIESDKAASYKPFEDTTNRYGYVRAITMIEKVLPDTSIKCEGAANLRTLLATIKQKSTSIQIEQVNVIGKPFRALVKYKNTDTLYCKLIDITNDNNIWNLNTYDNSLWSYIKGLNPVRTINQWLPPTSDYQQHSTEIKIDALPVGAYALVTSTGKNFNHFAHEMTVTYFYVSNISYIKGHNNDYYVLDRESGAPKEKVEVKVLERNDGSNGDRTKYHTLATRVSDSKGYFSLNNVNSKYKYYNYELSFKSATDELHIRTSQYNYEYNQRDRRQKTHTATFFTDKGIYRPSQTVYFKAIIFTKEKSDEQHLYQSKDSITLFLKDVNRVVLDSLKCLVNDYGSINGKFVLPQNLLTGNCSISLGKGIYGTAFFKIEEYKRPTYAVSINKPKGSYRLNNTITVIGTAKAFAGNTIDNAKVVFNVIRRTRYQYDYYGWWSRSRPSNEMEISHGTITTDAAGKFTISFAAIPDKAIAKETNPTFDYSIEATVTDGGGETRRANANVSVSYQSLQLEVTVPSISLKEDFKAIEINTTNLSGENEAATVGVNIYPLKSPLKIVRERLWERADVFVMDRKSYETAFPDDDYNDDNNVINWQVGNAVLKEQINTATETNLSVKNKLKAGYYKIETKVTDKYGEPLTVVKYVQVFDGKELSYPQNNFNYAIKTTVEPGETAKYLAGTSHKEITVLQQTIRQKMYGEYAYDSLKILTRKKGLQTIAYTASESDRGGLSIQEVFVQNNRVYINNYPVYVPWTNKELTVNYATYRNKTEPGSKEKWTVTIKDKKGDKVAAELLATMYDASLDQFEAHWLNNPYIWQTHYYSQTWTKGQGFEMSTGSGNYLSAPSYSFSKSYDKLLATDNTWGGRLYNSSPLIRSMSRNNMDEVVVIGYGAVKKKDLTGSVSSMKQELMSASPNNSIDQALAGKVAGVYVSSPGSGSNIKIRGSATSSNSKPLYIVDGIEMADIGSINKDDIESFDVLKDVTELVKYGAKGANGVIIITTKKGNQNNKPIPTRTNFNETAFFFPELHADTGGNYTVSFTMPDALTQWKWLSFAHTKDLQFGSQKALITSQKTLMVQSNAPRFMREGDQLDFSTKISNLSTTLLTGKVCLELVDALTDKPLDGLFHNVNPSQSFTVNAGQSTSFKFPLNIPYNYNKPLLWKVVARAGDYSDGEEKIIPVVTNRQLVTESMPILVKGDTTVHFVFDKLLSGNKGSQTLSNESVTVECTPNPVWYAVQGLPYLMEYPYECAEQTFNRFYANALAAFIVAKHPRIKAVFAEWMKDSSSLKSNLYKNQELKQILLEETPWVFDAQNETKQQHNIALLFDMVRMANSTESALDKLKGMQLDNGGFAWFKGGYEDRYITNYILTGIGKLKKAGALTPELNDKLQAIISKALGFMDAKIGEDYQWLIAHHIEMEQMHIGSTEIQYLFMRSFWTDNLLSDKVAYNYYYNQGKKYWVKQSLYNQALLGIAFGRNGEADFSLKNIFPSISENAIHNKLGMYWKETSTCFWYQNPVEYESAMIAFYNEMLGYKSDAKISQDISDMKTWLILNKQTNNWKTTVATADACYALLMGEDDLLDKNKTMNISLGSLQLSSATEKSAAGTDYIKERIGGENINTSMGDITVTTKTYGLNNQPVAKPDRGISYGAVYWQYFEDMDKITPAATPLSIKKQLFIEKNTNKGKVITPVNNNDVLKVGDKVVIRLELRSDRDMEYLHLKDMRAATMEPENVLSSYKWQDGLGYYEATKDASTNFFISYLQKGTYVFEYPVYITHTGNFSTGTANIQCMYAPEFTSHSEGMKVSVLP